MSLDPHEYGHWPRGVVYSPAITQRFRWVGMAYRKPSIQITLVVAERGRVSCKIHRKSTKTLGTLDRLRKPVLVTENISHHHVPIHPSQILFPPGIAHRLGSSSTLELHSASGGTEAHNGERDLEPDIQIPPPEELARMLSPKTPTPDTDAVGKLLRLNNYECIVEKRPFLDALNDVVARIHTFDAQPLGSAESASYPGLVKFLTECVEACHKALDRQPELPPRQERWYKKLEFTVAWKVADRVDHASPLWPDITGGKGISAFRGEQLYWRSPPEKPNRRITLPMELKNNWRDMVSQAATYARSLFSANPMRTFALILAFNQ